MSLFCTRASSVETGHIALYTATANTQISNLNLSDITFNGTADATYEVIQVTTNGAGSYDSNPANHTYRSTGHGVADSDMVAAQTDVWDSDTYTAPGGSTTATITVDIVTDTKYLTLVAGEWTQWVVNPTWYATDIGATEWPDQVFAQDGVGGKVLWSIYTNTLEASDEAKCDFRFVRK